MFQIVAHALAIALHVFSLQRHDLPLPVAVLCAVCTASSSLAMAREPACYQADLFSCTWLCTARKLIVGCAADLQAIVCTASSSLAAAVGMIQMGGGGSGLLAFLVMAWASLLPLGLFFQAVLPLPLPQGPLPYGGLTPSFEHERAEAYRCARGWCMRGPQHDNA